MPVWKGVSGDLQDLLTIHEVGHAVLTPAEGWMEALESISKKVYGKVTSRTKGAIHGFLNVIEDARVDRLQKIRFPGARRNYNIGYAELRNRDFFGTKFRDIDTYPFIDRANIFFKGGYNLGITFSAEEKELLGKIEKTESFSDVVAVTEEVFKWAMHKKATESLTAHSDEFGFGDFDVRVIEDEEDEDDDDFNFGSSDGIPVLGTEEDDDEEESEEDSDPGENAPPVNDIIPPPPVVEEQPDELPIPEKKEEEELIIPQSLTNEAWEKAAEGLIEKTDEEYIYVNYPLPLYDAIFDDYKKVLADYREIMKSSPNTMKSSRHQLSVWRKRLRTCSRGLVSRRLVSSIPTSSMPTGPARTCFVACPSLRVARTMASSWCLTGRPA
jgi:hypothetical protein